MLQGCAQNSKQTLAAENRGLLDRWILRPRGYNTAPSLITHPVLMGCCFHVGQLKKKNKIAITNGEQKKKLHKALSQHPSQSFSAGGKKFGERCTLYLRGGFILACGLSLL